MMVMSRVRVAIVSESLRDSMSLNDLPNCSQNHAIPPGPAGCPPAWVMVGEVGVVPFLNRQGRITHSCEGVKGRLPALGYLGRH